MTPVSLTPLDGGMPRATTARRVGVTDGSVYRRKDGRWVAVAWVNGVRREIYARTEEEAKERRARQHERT